MHKPRNLTRTTLNEVVAAEAGVSLETAVKVLQAFFDVVGRTIAAGFKVNVTNFGTWYRSTVASRERRDPNSGEEYRQGRTDYPRFRYAPRLRDAVTSGEELVTLRKRGH